jgi:nucleotide-binding universal stress UspA family protein
MAHSRQPDPRPAEPGSTDGVAAASELANGSAAMEFKDILVCLDPTDAGEARLRLAVAIARGHRANLSAAYIAQQEIAGAGSYGGIGIGAPAGAAGIAEDSVVAGVPLPGAPPAIGPDTSRGAAVADIVEQRFREAAGPHAIEGGWHLFGAGESEDFVALATAVDLVIFGQTSPDYRLPTGFSPGDLVLACGRPMLLVPYVGEFAAIGRRVLVAWDGTREASRALHDALPLLSKADAVTVMTVRRRETAFEQDAPLLARVVRHLQRHGIAARAEEALRGDLPISDVLLSRAADLDADLIVAGAYHHGQLREALFGGVSRDLLDHMTVPVLMSH